MRHSFPKFRPSKAHKSLAEALAKLIESSDLFEDSDVLIVWEDWVEMEETTYQANISCTPRSPDPDITLYLDIEVIDGAWSGYMSGTKSLHGREALHLSSVFPPSIDPDSLLDSVRLEIEDLEFSATETAR